MSATCPCGSSYSYEQCCGRFHLSAIPTTALELMKARYSAYATQHVDFILLTTHPQHVDQQKPLSKRKEEILHFSTTTLFKKLTILSFEEGSHLSYVTFRADLEQGAQAFSFQERSTFEKLEGRWYYLCGAVL